MNLRTLAVLGILAISQAASAQVSEFERGYQAGLAACHAGGGGGVASLTLWECSISNLQLVQHGSSVLEFTYSGFGSGSSEMEATQRAFRDCERNFDRNQGHDPVFRRYHQSRDCAAAAVAARGLGYESPKCESRPTNLSAVTRVTCCCAYSDGSACKNADERAKNTVSGTSLDAVESQCRAKGSSGFPRHVSKCEFY